MQIFFIVGIPEEQGLFFCWPASHGNLSSSKTKIIVYVQGTLHNFRSAALHWFEIRVRQQIKSCCWSIKCYPREMHVFQGGRSMWGGNQWCTLHWVWISHPEVRRFHGAFHISSHKADVDVYNSSWIDLNSPTWDMKRSSKFINHQCWTLNEAPTHEFMRGIMEACACAAVPSVQFPVYDCAILFYQLHA